MTLITKASGTKETYSEKKFITSLLRSGVSSPVAKRIAHGMRSEIFPGMSTKQLYRTARNLLKRDARNFAARYSMKKALMQLGPTGYPFERLVGAIFGARGHATQFDVMMKGSHATHEIDVVAVKGLEKYFVECKFHKADGSKSDLKVALYVHARAMDLRARLGRRGLSAFHLVTNTKFTSEALKYGTGVGLTMWSWDYPPKQGLRNLLEEYRLHPITCLTTLNGNQKASLLGKNIVLCQELNREKKLLRKLGLEPGRIQQVEKELAMVLDGDAYVRS